MGGGGVNGSRIKFLSQETGLCLTFITPSKNPWKKVMKNTNQQNRNDPYKVMKLAEEEWDQTDTCLAKYGQKVNKRRAENYPADMSGLRPDMSSFTRYIQ
jgi:hypothetical protein